MKENEVVMENIIGMIVVTLKSTVMSNSILIGFSIGMLTIILESIIPILPLGFFIATNMLIFGNLIGFVLSWVATIIGCSISFFLFRQGFHFVKRNEKIERFISKVNKIPFPTLVLMMSFPFSPAFLFNIAAGCSKLTYPKYLIALFLSKAIVVYFWGFIGTTLVESITNTAVLWKLSLLLLFVFLLSKIAVRNFRLE